MTSFLWPGQSILLKFHEHVNLFIMAYKLDGSPIAYGTPFRKGDFKYTKAWWSTTSLSEKNSVGVTEVADPAWFDHRFYWGLNNPKSIADLKAFWIKEQKNIANSKLAETDWLIVRKTESGTAVPSDTTTYRAAVRTKCKEREDQITACSDTDALALLVGSSETQSERGTADNGAEEEKQADGSSYDPKRYEDIQVANPAALKQWPTES